MIMNFKAQRHLIFALSLFLVLILSAAGRPGAAANLTRSSAIALREENGKLYAYDSSGRQLKKTWKTIRKKRYYFRRNGAAATGPVKINSRTYLFSEKGILQRNKSLVYKGRWYRSNRKGIVSHTMNGLEKQLRSAIRGSYGKWSIYVKNLDTGETISIHNQKMYAASLIKLFTAGAACSRIESGQLSASAVDPYISPMITASDNWAFNEVVRQLGKRSVNKWCRANGYKQTRQVHGSIYAANNIDLRSGSGSNVTSVEDCGRFLESVYRGTCVSKSASEKILDLLKRQERRTKIPAGVPYGVVVANKTGETDDYCHDAAIIYSPGATYILCVMSNVPGSGWASAAKVRELSSLTYNYLN